MSLALHRSLTFWSGLLVIGFVSWAWWDSLTWMNSVSPAGRLSAYSGYGGLCAESNDIVVRTTEYGRGRLPRPELVQAAGIFQSPFFVRGTGRGASTRTNSKTLREESYRFSDVQSPKSWRFFIPFWLILLAVAAPWLGLLVWRARRRAAADRGIAR
jgi:hypothetical protein